MDIPQKRAEAPEFEKEVSAAAENDAEKEEAEEIRRLSMLHPNALYALSVRANLRMANALEDIADMLEENLASHEKRGT